LLLDCPRLAENYVEYRTVDWIVLAIDEDCPDGVALLSEAIDAPLALLVPSRVPGQVVMDDRIEIHLQIDALGEAVGGNQNALVVLAKRLNPRFTILGRNVSRDHIDGPFFEGGRERFSNRVGRRYVATEDDRVRLYR
jgi:hypothetical protein